jgi:hypothetical protein
MELSRIAKLIFSQSRAPLELKTTMDELQKTDELPRLTGKQERFVDAYLGKAMCNASMAARMAGYSEDCVGVQGCDNLKNPSIKAHIAARASEIGMGGAETLQRLRSMASADITRAMDDDGNVVLEKLVSEGMGHLIKSVKRVETKDGTNVTFELYDAQAAVLAFAKINSLLVERREMTGRGGGPIEIAATALSTRYTAEELQCIALTGDLPDELPDVDQERGQTANR